MSNAIDASPNIALRKRRGPLADFFIRLLKEKPLGIVGAIIVLILLFAGVFANVLAPDEMNEIHLESRLEAPSARYWLGTDQLGRDVLSRIIYGARISVIISLSATFLNIITATMIGAVTGYLGGKLDLIVQRFVDARLAFPTLLILITVMSMVGQGTMQIILVLGIWTGIGSSRITRSAVIAIKEETYMRAARAIGCTNGRILTHHILPNIMAPIIIIFSTTIGMIILFEASLSFLGFGLPPDVASWGGMLSGEGRKFMELAPRLAVWPGACLSIVVYGTNMLGDAMRDLLDPRLRGGGGRMDGRGTGSTRKGHREKEIKAKKV